MKVTIIVGGRFHAFDLAAQLQSRGLLNQLITTYPKSKAEKFNIPKSKIISFSLIEYFKRGVHKLLGFYPLNFFLADLFDKLASRRLNLDSDVYILWAGMALHSIKKIRKGNPKAKIIIERGSVHISEQNQLLKIITGKNIVDNRTIQKELIEYELTDYISLPSSFAKTSFLKNNINITKLFVNPYGVDLKLFSPQNKTRTTNQLIVGYAGTISAQKNIEGLISAVEFLVQNGNDIKLHLVGNIDKKTFSDELLKKQFINYRAAIAQKELNDFYNNIDVFILNSVQDGFGMVLLQALSCGKPVIATQNTGGPDVIIDGENGFIIPPFSETNLIDKIQWFCELSAQKMENMNKKAVESVNSGFSWSDYGDRYVKFLKIIT